MHSKSEFRETRCISFYSYHFSPLLRRQFANTFIVLAEKYEFEGRARKLYTKRYIESESFQVLLVRIRE